MFYADRLARRDELTIGAAGSGVDDYER